MRQQAVVIIHRFRDFGHFIAGSIHRAIPHQILDPSWEAIISLQRFSFLIYVYAPLEVFILIREHPSKGNKIWFCANGISPGKITDLTYPRCVNHVRAELKFLNGSSVDLAWQCRVRINTVEIVGVKDLHMIYG